MHADPHIQNENPYIALSDMAINVVLVLIFFYSAANAIGRAGWEKILYTEYQRKFRQQLEQSRLTEMPIEKNWSNDPPGVQRWMFPEETLFHRNTATISLQGQNSLVRFARVLERNHSLWRRIRIEGHTMPPTSKLFDDWELSAARAASVARILNSRGHIRPYYLAVAGRAGQNPFNKENPQDPKNERVEIVIEYTQQRNPKIATRPSPTDKEKKAYLAAAASGDIRAVLQFVSRYPDAIDLSDLSGATALHHAVAKDHVEIVRFLLSYGADVNCAKRNGVTAMHIAAALGRTEAIKLLLNCNAEMNVRDSMGRTPLKCAAANGNDAIVRYLESQGASR